MAQFPEARHAARRVRRALQRVSQRVDTSTLNEIAQDAVGSILDTGSVGNIVFNYNDSGNIISATIKDGDRGDITVSIDGSTWTIDDGVVSNNKLADIIDLGGSV